MSSSSVCSGPEGREPRSLSRRLALAGAAAWALGPLSALSARAPEGAAAAPAEVRAEMPQARIVGQGRLRYLGLHIYDAVLWSEATGPALSLDQHPLALELKYARSLKGPLIAERSLKEMRRVGEVSEADGQRWLMQMKELFPDVVAGDRLTGMHRPGELARFYLNGQARGELRDATFTRLFFGIWLSPRTSQPALRLALLGQPRDSGGAARPDDTRS
jgi:Chalcone isomerase-like